MGLSSRNVKRSNKIIIGRSINGISLNGLEWLLDKKGKEKEFRSEDIAKNFLKSHGYEDFSDEEIEDNFIFKEKDEK